MHWHSLGLSWLIKRVVALTYLYLTFCPKHCKLGLFHPLCDLIRYGYNGYSKWDILDRIEFFYRILNKCSRLNQIYYISSDSLSDLLGYALFPGLLTHCLKPPLNWYLFILLCNKLLPFNEYLLFYCTSNWKPLWCGIGNRELCNQQTQNLCIAA